MTRCVSFALAAGLVAGTLAGPAWAQANRNFPAGALRGEIVITQPPELQVNGKPARLAPGARIRDGQNMLQLSGSLVGRKLLVHYTLDLQGQVLDVWMLNPAEAARKPWPETPAQAAAWRFDFDAQRWSKP